jgi:uncharacterized membrane protein
MRRAGRPVSSKNVKARRARVIGAWTLLVLSVIGWPVSALTLARNEPQFILGLSWMAIVIEAASLLTSSQVHEEQAEDDKQGG